MPEERSILAYFSSDTKAKEAQNELINNGYQTVQLDRVSLFPGQGEGVSNPLTGNFRSLANLTLGLDNISDNEGIALAAHPSASGMAAAPQPRETPFLLTIVCPESDVDKAVEIVKKYGARV